MLPPVDRAVSASQAERRHRRETTQSHATERKTVHASAAAADRRADAGDENDPADPAEILGLS